HALSLDPSGRAISALEGRTHRLHRATETVSGRLGVGHVVLIAPGVSLKLTPVQPHRVSHDVRRGRAFDCLLREHSVPASARGAHSATVTAARPHSRTTRPVFAGRTLSQ